MNKPVHFVLKTKILRLLPLVAVILLTLSLPAQVEADYYVRAGALGTGNGSDWNNAYPSLPATLIRGETYWIADGNYAAYVFDDAVSGSSYINIRKATISDHGTNTGWLSSYGVGQVTFPYMQITTSSWYIDGGSTTSYGIVINNIKSTQAGFYIGGTGSTISNITVKSVSVDATGAPDSTRCVHLQSSGSNFLLSNVETKKSSNDAFAVLSVKDSIMEYLYLHSKVNTTYHGDGMEIGWTENLTIRYSRFNWDGQMIFWRGDATSGTHYIYGNIFYNAPNGNTIHSQSGDTVVGPVYIYNNTFVNVSYGIYVLSKTTGDARNNIFYGTTPSLGWGSMTHDYNAAQTNLGEVHGQLLSSNPFVNSSTNNYHLSAATKAGDSSIGTMYQTDPDGKIRGGDGLWNRGAFEYTGTGKIPNYPGINPFQ